MDTTRKKDSFIKGAIILSVAGVVIKILGAFFRIPLTYIIGSEGMGYYQTAYPIYTLFLTLATAGFPTAVAKLVSEKVAVGDYRGANKVFKISHGILFLTGVIGFLILFFGASFIVNNVQKNPNALYAIKAIAPAILIVPSMSAYRGYYQGHQDMSKIAISQLIEQLFKLILGLTLAYMLMKSLDARFGSAGALLGATLGAFASFLYLLFTYLRTRGERRLQLENSIQFKDEKNSQILKKILKVAIPICIGAMVMPLVSMVDSVIVIRRLMVAGYSLDAANSALGQLGMGVAVANIPMVVTTAMGMSLVPAISESFALGKFKEARKNSKMAIKITLLLVLPCAFGLASLSSPIMNLLYPKEPMNVIGAILFVLTPSTIFLGLLYSFNGILQGMGKPFIPVYALLCGMVGKIVISYVFTAIPAINVLGSAFGTVASYLIAVIIEFIYIKRSMNMKISYMEFAIKPLITVLLMFIGVKLSFAAISVILGYKLATILSIAVGGTIYVVVLLKIGGITVEEIKTMYKGEKILKILKKIKLVK